ncbi:DUF3638 domain-containing protein [Gammaproteobacteria bacterium]|nr:DUF3638 domain-containing protein [Gammaproteobacteria bacterium]
MRINERLIAHLCLDDEVKNAYQLEGLQFVEAITYFTEHFSSYFSEDDQWSGLNAHFKQLKYFAERISKVTSDKQDATYDVANQIAKYIDQLQENNTKSYVLMPIGWITKTKGHAMVAKFFKEDGYLKLTVLNTGSGIQYHARRVINHLDQFYPLLTYQAKIESIDFRKFGEEFIDLLIKPQLPQQSIYFTDQQMSAETIYRNILQKFLNLYNGHILIPEASQLREDLWTTGQVAGTCTQRCLHLLLKEQLNNPQQLKQAMLDFKLVSLEKFTKSLSKISTRQTQLISLSVKHIASLLVVTSMDSSQKASYQRQLLAIKELYQQRLSDITSLSQQGIWPAPNIYNSNHQCTPITVDLLQEQHIAIKPDQALIFKPYHQIKPFQLHDIKSWLSHVQTATQGFAVLRFKALEAAILSLPYGDAVKHDYDFLVHQDDFFKKEYLQALRDLQNDYFKTAYQFIRKDIYLPRMFLVKVHLLAVADHLNEHVIWQTHQQYNKEGYGKFLRYRLLQLDLAYYDSPYLNQTDHHYNRKLIHIFDFFKGRCTGVSDPLCDIYDSLLTEVDKMAVNAHALFNSWYKTLYHQQQKTIGQSRFLFFVFKHRQLSDLSSDQQAVWQKIDLQEAFDQLLDFSYFGSDAAFVPKDQKNATSIFLTGDITWVTGPNFSSAYNIFNAWKRSMHDLALETMPGLLALQTTNVQKNHLSDNDIYVSNEVQGPASDRANYRQLTTLRNSTATQFLTTIDYFLDHLFLLDKADQQFYVTSNLLQPKVIDKALGGQACELEATRFRLFIAQGVKYFQRQNVLLVDSLFFVELAWRVAHYRPDGAYQMGECIVWINELLIQPLSPEARDCLHLYRFLAYTSQMVHGDALDRHKAYFDYMKVQISPVIGKYMKPDIKVLLTIAQSDFREYLQQHHFIKNDLSCFADSLNALIGPPDKFDFDQVSQTIQFQCNGQPLTLHIFEGLVYNCDHRALVATPDHILHHPYLKWIQTAHPVTDCDTAFVSDDATIYTLKNNLLEFRGKSDDMTVYYHWEGDWARVYHANARRAELLGLMPYPKALESFLNDYEVWVLGSELVIASCGQPLFRSAKKKLITIEHRRVLMNMYDQLLGRFESPDYQYAIKKNDHLDLHFPRYGLKLRKQDGLVFYDDSQNQSYHLLETEALVEGCADLQFQHQTTMQRLMLLPVKPFIAINEPSAHSLYYQAQQDKSQTVLNDQLARLKNDNEHETREYNQINDSESFEVFNMDRNSQPIPTSFQQVLLLSYVYLAGKQEVAAWQLLSSNHFQMTGQWQELTYIYWIFAYLPYHRLDDEFEACHLNSLVVQCQLKVMSFLVSYLNRGGVLALSAPNKFPVQTQQHVVLQAFERSVVAFYQSLDEKVTELFSDVDKRHVSIRKNAITKQDLDQLLCFLKHSGYFCKNRGIAIYGQYLFRSAQVHAVAEKTCQDQFGESLESKKQRFIQSKGGLDIYEDKLLVSREGAFKGPYDFRDTSHFSTGDVGTSICEVSSLFSESFKARLLHDLNIHCVYIKASSLDKNSDQLNQLYLMLSTLGWPSEALQDIQQVEREIESYNQRLDQLNWEKNFITKVFPVMVHIAASLDKNPDHEALGQQLEQFCQMQLIEGASSELSTNLPMLAHVLYQILKKPIDFQLFSDIDQLKVKYLGTYFYDFYDDLFHAVDHKTDLFFNYHQVSRSVLRKHPKISYLEDAKCQLSSVDEEPQQSPNTPELLDIHLTGYQLRDSNFEEQISKNNLNKRRIKQWILDYRSVEQSIAGDLSLDQAYMITKKDLILWYERGGFPAYFPVCARADFDQLMCQYLHDNAILKTAKALFDQDPDQYQQIDTFQNQISVQQSKDYRDVVLYQNRVKVLIRADQKVLIDSVKHQDQPVLLMQIGGGKTKVIIPILLQMANGNNLVCVMVPSALLNTNVADLSVTSQRLGQQPFVLRFNRQSSIAPKDLKQLFNQLNQVRRHRGYVITTIESMQSLSLRWFELMNMTEDEKNAESIQLLKHIYTLMKDRGLWIIDEIHEALFHNTMLNYTMGQSQSVKPMVIEHSLSLWRQYALDYRGEKDDQATIEAFLYRFIQTGVLKQISEKNKIDSQHLKSYLLDQHRLPEQALTEETQEILSIYKAQFSVFLPFALKQKPMVDYGPSQVIKNPFKAAVSIPYQGNNHPKEHSRFANALEVINKTILWHLEYGLTWSEFERFIQSLLSQADYEKRRDDLQDIDQTQTNIMYQDLLGTPFSQINLQQDHNIQVLFASNRRKVDIIMDVLEKYVLPEITLNQEQLICNAFHAVDMANRVLGLSGTPDNHYTFHQSLTHDLPLLELTNQQVQSVVKNPEKTKIEYINPVKKDSLTWLKDIVNNDFHALIDINATFQGIENKVVAEALIDATDFIYVLYFNADQYLCAMDRHKQEILIGSSSESHIFAHLKVGPEQRLTYYDQSHTTGIDIKQAPSARALALMDMQCMLSECLQAFCRMRGYVSGEQTITLKVQGAEPMTSDLLISRLRENQLTRLEQYHFDASQMKCHAVMRQAALQQIYQASEVTDMYQLFKQYRHYFIHQQCESYTEHFGQVSETQATHEILEQTKVALINDYQALAGQDQLKHITEQLDLILKQSQSMPMAKSQTQQVISVGTQQEFEVQVQIEQQVQEPPMAKREPYLFQPWDFDAINRLSPNELCNLSIPFHENICMTVNLLRVYHDQPERTLHECTKMVHALWFEYEPARQEIKLCLMLTAQETQMIMEHLEKISSKHFFMISTYQTPLAGSQPKWLDHHSVYQSMVEQIAIFNGQFNFLSQRDHLFLQDIQGWLKQYRMYIDPCRPESRKDFENFDQQGLSIMTIYDRLSLKINDNSVDVQSLIDDLNRWDRRKVEVFIEAKQQASSGSTVPNLDHLQKQYMDRYLAYLDAIKNHDLSVFNQCFTDALSFLPVDQCAAFESFIITCCKQRDDIEACLRYWQPVTDNLLEKLLLRSDLVGKSWLIELIDQPSAPIASLIALIQCQASEDIYQCLGDLKIDQLGQSAVAYALTKCSQLPDGQDRTDIYLTLTNHQDFSNIQDLGLLTQLAVYAYSTEQQTEQIFGHLLKHSLFSTHCDLLSPMAQRASADHLRQIMVFSKSLPNLIDQQKVYLAVIKNPVFADLDDCNMLSLIASHHYSDDIFSQSVLEKILSHSYAKQRSSLLTQMVSHQPLTAEDLTKIYHITSCIEDRSDLLLAIVNHANFSQVSDTDILKELAVLSYEDDERTIQAMDALLKNLVACSHMNIIEQITSQPCASSAHLTNAYQASVTVSGDRSKVLQKIAVHPNFKAVSDESVLRGMASYDYKDAMTSQGILDHLLNHEIASKDPQVLEHLVSQPSANSEYLTNAYQASVAVSGDRSKVLQKIAVHPNFKAVSDASVLRGMASYDYKDAMISQGILDHLLNHEIASKDPQVLEQLVSQPSANSEHLISICQSAKQLSGGSAQILKKLVSHPSFSQVSDIEMFRVLASDQSLDDATVQVVAEKLLQHSLACQDVQTLQGIANHTLSSQASLLKVYMLADNLAIDEQANIKTAIKNHQNHTLKTRCIIFFCSPWSAHVLTTIVIVLTAIALWWLMGCQKMLWMGLLSVYLSQLLIDSLLMGHRHTAIRLVGLLMGASMMLLTLYWLTLSVPMFLMLVHQHPWLAVIPTALYVVLHGLRIMIGNICKVELSHHTKLDTNAASMFTGKSSVINDLSGQVALKVEQTELDDDVSDCSTEVSDQDFDAQQTFI